MPTRRNFVKQSLLAAGGLALSSSAFGRVFIGSKLRVIIIGAGFAGLSAAYELKKKGIEYVVLESRNRINGRVFSHAMTSNLVVELGAEWVGESHTHIRELCGQFDLELFNNQLDTRLIYEGKYYDKGQWDYTEGWKKKYDQLLNTYRNSSDDDKKALDKYDWWRYLVNNGCDGRDLDLRELLDSTDFGESLRHVSAFAVMDEYSISSPKNEMDMKIRGGNAALGNKLADAIGRENILLQHSVQRIVQADGVTVYCDNGKVFKADKIICTTPTFSLKKISWEPELTVEHLAAINELQYARINKNPMLFSERFWKDESFDLVTDTTAHYFYHATKNQKAKEGVLIAYSIGDKAAVIAAQNDAFRGRLANQALSPHFKGIQNKLLKQTNYYWGKDQYSRGSYAMFGPGQWFPVRKALKQQHIHTLFAGEHLADWQGFMEGALITGKEAAEQI